MDIFRQYSKVMNVTHLILWMESTVKQTCCLWKCVRMTDKDNCADTEYLAFSRAFDLVHSYLMKKISIVELYHINY